MIALGRGATAMVGRQPLRIGGKDLAADIVQRSRDDVRIRLERGQIRMAASSAFSNANAAVLLVAMARLNICSC